MPLKLTVKVPGKGPVQVDVEDDNSTVETLKALLEEKIEMPSSQQKLVFKGKVLKDQETLSEKKVADGATVFLVGVNFFVVP